MKKSDVQCPDCGAGFRRLELASRPGTATTNASCAIASWRHSTASTRSPIAWLWIQSGPPVAPKQNCHISLLAFWLQLWRL